METTEKIISLDRTVITQKLFTGHSARSLMYTHKKRCLMLLRAAYVVFLCDEQIIAANVSTCPFPLNSCFGWNYLPIQIATQFPGFLLLLKSGLKTYIGLHSLFLIISTLFGNKKVAQTRQEFRYSTDYCMYMLLSFQTVPMLIFHLCIKPVSFVQQKCQVAIKHLIDEGESAACFTLIY